ncbi:hypothetical protein DID73_01250 [Candidatus Marinamargulisbacteria bacterium SCGC AG-343-K17]|nr:hypothetical protein DID73_01250 [Candidatus Marinamargulisbacteria bacterium SCGC AG-343-K17]
MKLQHVLSKQGIFSRRVAETMIKDGYVLVNDDIQTNHLFQVSDQDQVSFADKIHDYAKQLGVLLVHKPRGVWTNCKIGVQEKEVVDLLPRKYQGYSSIGRLDKDSEGLILFTNDGVFANQFLNSDEIHERVYHVWTKQPLTAAHQRTLRSGVLLKDGMTQPCRLTEIKRNCYEIRLVEGKNRQIRRMVEICGTHVTRLKRLSFGDYTLGGIVAGQYRFQSLSELFLKRLNAFD